MIKDLIPILVPLGVCVALPVLIVWLITRKNANDTNKRTEIALAAINSNSDIDIEDFFKKMTPQQKSLKERLLSKLQKGLICIAIGLSLIGNGIFSNFANPHDSMGLYLFGAILTSTGVAIIIVYFISKRTLAKELEETETKN